MIAWSTIAELLTKCSSHCHSNLAVEEVLLASLLVTSLLEMLVSLTETAVSPTSNKTIPVSMIARMAKTGLFTSTSSK